MSNPTVKQQFYALIEKQKIVSTRSKFLYLELAIPVILFFLSFYTDLSEAFWVIVMIGSSFSLLFFVSNFVFQFIEEKGGKIKETLKIMGMKQISYDLSWFSILYLKAAVVFVVSVIFPAIINNFDKNVASLFVCVLIFFFYYTAVIHQAFLYTVFFSNSRIGSYLYGVFFLIQGLIFLAGCDMTPYDQEKAYYWNTCDTSINYYLSIFPQFAFTQAMKQYKPFSFYWYGDDGEQPPQPGSKAYDERLSLTTPNTYLYFLIGDTFVYLILYLYLNQIWPNDYGTQKSIFFPCMCKKRKNISSNKNQMKQQLLENSRKSFTNELQEDYSNAVYHEKFENLDNVNQTIRIKQLRKKFGSFYAVDGLDLCLYEKQIFCLLGHNGSGKTTTINLLTGMLPKSSGDVNMRGEDLDDDLDTIRESLGLCSQKDILFDNLTVVEHLILMAKMKGVSEENIPQQLNLMLEKCMLNTEKTKKASNLSGGNKRKLSLAMALIGDSKILLLDEPSSGLDPSSRKIIWDILKKVKNENRTIILTTHHLEEAEELAERIGIMAKGKLLTVGTCNFIKKQFGIGFHLEILISKQNNQNNEQLSNNNNTFDSATNQIQQNNQIQFNQQQQFNQPPQLESAKNLNLQQNQILSLEETRAAIINIVQNVIEGSKFNKQSTNEMVKFVLPFDKRDQFQELFRQLEVYPNLSMNLQINSLEEAFVNIGMDEEKLLNKKQQELNMTDEQKLVNQVEMQDQNDNYTNFDQIKVPQCLNKSPVYDFWSQTKAIYTKKMYMQYRSKTSLFGVMVPFLLLIGLQTLAAFFVDDYLYSNITGESFDDLKPALPVYDSQMTMLIFSLIGSYSLFITCFGVTIVQERYQKQKYALNVMGCRVYPYWVGNFLFDYTMLVIINIMFIIYSFIVPFFMQDFANLNVVNKLIPQWIILLLVLNFTFITLSYLLSFRFEKTSSAQMALFWLTIIVFVGIPNLLVTPLEFTDNAWKYSSLHIMFYFLSPLYALQDVGDVMIIHNQSQVGVKYTDKLIQQAADYKYPKPENCNLDLNYMWYYLPIFIAQGLFYSFCVLKLDQRKNNLKEAPSLNTIDDDLAEMEPEVLEEQERLENPDCDDIVKVTKLSKQYPNGFTAIRNNNFGVKKGEIFGLLGPNGSGKSTTFNILTSFIPKTDGSVKLKNIEVDKGIMDIYQNVGICPQFDCIWEQLTVYEHLRLYGMMKGLQNQDLAESIQYFLEVMQLVPYKNVKSGRLSGGNKRKLCVSLALIGGPDMQFFDEPSSGVDPIAKRFLWNSLTQNLKLRGSAITLTTHSMIEAESLSHKIGILINGRMQCYGTPDFLKKKYGEGYIISLETTLGQQNEVLSQIQQNFPEVKQQKIENKDNLNQSEQNKNELAIQIDPQQQQQNDEQNFLPTTLVIKAPYEGFSFYKTFNFYDQLLENKQITDFSVSQSSLEKIFLEFSKLQHTGEGENIGKKKKK